MYEYKILKKARGFKVSLSFEIPGDQENLAQELQDKLWLLTQTRGYSLRTLVSLGIRYAGYLESGGRDVL